MLRRLPETIHTPASRRENIEKTILSVSGWRKIFARETTGSSPEESLSPDLASVDEEMLAIAAVTIGRFFFKQNPEALIAVGRDSRPTGSAMEQIIIQGLLAADVKVRQIGLTAVPQVLAYVGETPAVTGFVYLTASHNPPGYNGLKIGGSTGEVFAAAEAGALIEAFRKNYLGDSECFEAVVRFNSAAPGLLEETIKASQDHAQVARKKYFSRMITILSGEATESRQSIFLKNLDENLHHQTIRVACDYNGSSRIASIDSEILDQFGIRTSSINHQLGHFAHRIVPEGESLEPLKNHMSQDASSYLAGYVPDCDGDRGNLILPILEDSGKLSLVVPDAQFTFALSVISELAFLDLFFPHLKEKAVVTNDATSLRIEAIASAFGARTFRAETGEANVLSLAKEKVAGGFSVRILGEGSNGGNITLPGTVRDPLSTIFSLIKFVYLRHPENKQFLWRHAMEKLKISPAGPMDKPVPAQIFSHFWTYNLGWSTTSVFEKEALFPVQTKSQSVLKSNYEKVFVKDWLSREADLKNRFGFTSYEFLQFEGINTRRGPGNRTGLEDGGFQIVFKNESGTPKGFVWMRGSKTEPVFRVMADLRGDREGEAYLLSWHRDVLRRADSGLL